MNLKNFKMKPVQAKYELRIESIDTDSRTLTCMVLIDENKGGKSLTNDMENVLNEVYGILKSDQVKSLPIINIP